MAGQAYLWAWDSVSGTFKKVLVDAAGHLQTDVLSQPDVAQATPENLKHVPHGYYPTGATYHPFQVDSAGKLSITLSSLARLGDIDDVYVPSPTDEYLLYWDAPNSRWACRALVDADIPATIARDTEVATAVSGHAALTTGVHAFYKGARAYHNADQSIANNTWTTVALNSERYDTDTIHDIVTNNERLTCKTAGIYLIKAHLYFPTNATGVRASRFILNDVTQICYFNIDAQAGVPTLVDIDTLFILAVNDFLRCDVYQNSGVALNIVYDPYSSPEFMMQRVA